MPEPLKVITTITQDAWLSSHPYLHGVADIQAKIDAAAARIDIPVAHVPDWEQYRNDYHAGIPLLQSDKAAIDLDRPEQAITQLTAALSATSLPAGSRRLLASVVLSRHLSAIVKAFGKWRDEDRWMKNYCPTCGERPAMAQLVGVDPGKMRLLSCGTCQTRWRYRRTACPFCDVQDEHTLTALGVDGEGGLRIDHCESCRGSIKTYNGEGNERLLLADWTSLHLDVLARDRGLKRLASSLFEI